MGGTMPPPCCLTWGQTMVELMKVMVTSFIRSVPLPLQQATADPYLCRKHSNTRRQVWLSLCGVYCCAQGLFEPSEQLWQLWGLIPNMILPLLPSCWCFSFALGCEISSSCRIQHSPVHGCSAASCNFGGLTEEDESFHPVHDLFTSPMIRATGRGLVPCRAWVSSIKQSQ